jgi:hypothetical protein
MKEPAHNKVRAEAEHIPAMLRIFMNRSLAPISYIR